MNARYWRIPQTSLNSLIFVYLWIFNFDDVIWSHSAMTILKNVDMLQFQHATCHSSHWVCRHTLFITFRCISLLLYCMHPWLVINFPWTPSQTNTLISTIHKRFCQLRWWQTFPWLFHANSSSPPSGLPKMQNCCSTPLPNWPSRSKFLNPFETWGLLLRCS